MGNLGQTSLKRRKRQGDPMQTFDALPLPVRQWMANASLPWSPNSVRNTWSRARARGLSEQAALEFLSKCETGMLDRDGVAQKFFHR
ncbi:MAG: DUF6525 family protein [Pseudomonadota bacterium]